MPLEVGARLGVYEIGHLLGEGGMGQVYRARDTTLERDVAIKVLPADLAGDPTSALRFEREARLLAALNHPHIATLFGLERVADTIGPPTIALVMELIDGPSLDTVAAGRPMPLADVVRLTSQIAEAVAYAHDHGIIHRDLKPGNIKVSSEGRAKVLDFGIAKAIRDARGPDTASAATETLDTEVGLVIGTAAYMSPEQARGADVDRRTDIWAFGCILFELLTGQRPFVGGTRSDVMAAVLAKEPDWSRLPSTTPHSILALLRRCLQKDRAERLRDMGDARMALEDAVAGEVTAPPPLRRGAVRAAAIAVGAAAIGALASWTAVRPASPVPTFAQHLEIATPLDRPINLATTTPTLAISRDGQRVAWVAGTSSSGGPLTVRDMGNLVSRTIADVAMTREPAFSPDGAWLVFLDNSVVNGGLRKVPVGGGAPITLAPLTGTLRGPSWADDGTIVFSSTNPATGLLKVSSDGGQVEVLTTPDAAKSEVDHLFPVVLPNGRGILFTIVAAGEGGTRVAVLDLESRGIKDLLPDAATARYAAGRLVYATGSTLAARPFDLDRLELTGEAVTLAEGVLAGTAGSAYFDVAATGTVVYVPAASAGDPLRRLVWVDRSGNETPVGAPDLPYRIVRLSPDGSQVALVLGDGGGDLWTWDLARGALARVTTNPRVDFSPVWTPDGRDLVYGVRQTASSLLLRQTAGGGAPPRRISSFQGTRVPTAITRDGAYLLGNQTVTGAWELFVMPLGRPAEVRTQFQEGGNLPSVSPDDRFVAFQSAVSGRSEIYVRPFPNVGEARWPVSTRGGILPVWRADGKELFYLDDDRRLTAVSVDTSGAAFRVEAPRRVLPTSYYVGDIHPYDVSPTGERFLMIKQLDLQRDSGGRIVVMRDVLAANR